MIPENDRTVGATLTKRAFLDPDKEALICQGTRLTYREFEEHANSVANSLLALGINRGDRVGILMHNSHEYLVMVFALAKIGAVAVLINFRLVLREILYILEDSGACALVCGSEFGSMVTEIRSSLSGIRHYVTTGDDTGEIAYRRLRDNGSTQPPKSTVDGSDALMIVYTAGTTGRPKGALISHENSLYSSLNTIISTKATVWAPLVAGPLFHVASINANSIPCVFIGGRQVILPAFEPESALQTIEKEQLSFSTGVPLFASLLLEVQREKNFDLSSLESLIIGGAPVPPALIGAWQDYGVRLVQLYGMTETTSGACFCDEIEIVRRKVGSAGKPVFFTDLRIVDLDGREAPTGAVGEITVKGPNVIKGYWNRPAENEENFKNGWFHTGDMGRLDEEGFLYVVDRKKDMIKTGGENVYPAELELVILEHPSVREVAVVGRADPKWGEAVAAVVVIKEACNLGREEFLEFCRANMARYKVPKTVRFVEELPRNVMGKVLKADIRKLVSE